MAIEGLSLWSPNTFHSWGVLKRGATQRRRFLDPCLFRLMGLKTPTKPTGLYLFGFFIRIFQQDFVEFDNQPNLGVGT